MPSTPRCGWPRPEGHRARLHIAVDNQPSQHVARATGFSELDLPLVERRRKGQVLHLAVWERTLQPAPAE